jgi:3'-5' exoribonuclease Rv2179c-like domain
MTAICYDTEFLEDGHTIRLISIGMIRDDGCWYYAVAKDHDLITLAYQHPWLSEHVIPGLPVKLIDVGADRPMWIWDAAHRDARDVKPRAQIAAEIAEFIQGTPDVELWADYGAYDHVALCQLWGRMIALPEGVPMWTHDLRQEWERYGKPIMPSRPGGQQHNALDDAYEVQFRRRWLAKHAAAGVVAERS